MKTPSPLAARLTLGAACLCVSASSFAQNASPYDTSQPLTRAQVIADLREWRNAGYDPQDWLNYPQTAQRAGHIVYQRRLQAMPAS